MSEVYLIRHEEVEEQSRKICYGSSDVRLSQAGKQASQDLALQFKDTPRPQVIFHSDLSRTQYLAQQLAANWDNEVPVIGDSGLRERNYGQWQGMTWDDAYACDPENFHHLIEQPDTYRPPEGETTTEMQTRIVSWHNEIISSYQNDKVIAISHSGPIAALAGWITKTPATQWETWMLKPLDFILINNSTIETMLH